MKKIDLKQKKFDLGFLDPIWLVASVEEGGLLGITQQLDQCHSLGMNPQSTMNYSSFSMTGVQPVVATNPFQSQRCKIRHDDEIFIEFFNEF